MKSIINNRIKQEYNLYVITIIINNIFNIYLFLYYLYIDNNYKFNNKSIINSIHNINMLRLCLHFDNNYQDLINRIVYLLILNYKNIYYL